MRIAILLPYKENYTKDLAGAASIWVKSYKKLSKFKKKIYVFGNLNKSRLPLTKNFINIDIKTKLFSKTREYVNNFYNYIFNKKFNIIEIHNRPEYFHILFKKQLNVSYTLVFHNNPLELIGSKSVNDRLFILKNCKNVIFVSHWVKKQFFSGLDLTDKNNTFVISPGITPLKKLFKKDKLIIFAGKLNKSKGYDIFGNAVIKILNKYIDWKAIVVGAEPREDIKFLHSRFKVIGWQNHQKVLELYKKASISVVPSKWEEPFGRTAMESSAYGCLTIISSRGGLKETYNYQDSVLLKKVETVCLYNLIEKFIKNKKLLKEIQIKNLNQPKHILKDKVNYMDQINEYKVDKINLVKAANPRILHIGNFNEKNSHRLFNISISNKLTSGFIRNNCDVLNFDYRDYSNSSLFFNKLEKINDIINNYKPNLLLLGHNNILDRNTLEFAKNNGAKIALWFEDSLHEQGPDSKNSISLLEKNEDLINNYFITTSPDIIKTKINKKKISFMPVPADKNIENLKIYENKNRYKDLFFGLSHGVNFGKLKKNNYDDRETFLLNLKKINSNISLELLGINNEEPKWGFEFSSAISKCKMALNLSRGIPVKFYSSNRIASYVANGIATLIDEKTQYRNFFDDSEILFYNNIDHLSEIIDSNRDNIKKLNKIGKNGKRRYFEIFDNSIVSQFILKKVFNIKNKDKIIWDK